jgi:hypothetical protein
MSQNSPLRIRRNRSFLDWTCRNGHLNESGSLEAEIE